MNCPSCGTPLPAGASQCPVCGTATAAYAPQNPYMQQPYGYPPSGAQTPGYGYGQQGAPGYPQQQSGPYAGGYNAPGYGAGYQQQPQPGYTGFPQGYQQPYTGGAAAGAPISQQLRQSLGMLPELLRTAFARPAQALGGLTARGDWLTGALLTALSLLVTFLGGLVVARQLVALMMPAIFAFASSFIGSSFNSLAGDSLSRYVSNLGAVVAPGLSGMAVLVRLLCLTATLAVTLCYLCGVKKKRFSLPLLGSLAGILCLPGIAADVLSFILSFLTPYGCMLATVLGLGAQLVLLGEMIVSQAALPEGGTALTKIVLLSIVLLLDLGIAALVGLPLSGSALAALGAV